MSAGYIAIRLLLSVISGAIIGYERGRHGRAAGLRTHMLVALGSAMASVVGIYMTQSGTWGDPSRIASSVISGMGFIGAGIIIVKGNTRITGLTTAAAMWATATVGLAYGAGLYTAGVMGTVIIIIVLILMTRLEIRQKTDCLYFLEIDDVNETNRVLEDLKERYPFSHSSGVVPARSGLPDHVGIIINIQNNEEDTIVSELRELNNVVYAVKE